MRCLLFSYAMGFAVIGAMASYLNAGKEHFLSDALFRDMMERMSHELSDAADNYLDLPEAVHGRLTPLSLHSGIRMKQFANGEQLFPADYDVFADTNPNPSIRDQEYLEHSSLWGNQYVSGGAGEGKQRLKPEGSVKNQQEVKTDATLPAYCNPPNPCPIGYDEHEGCTNSQDFENTAAFSRRYQAAQDCMCDTEHMFECPNQETDIRRADNMIGSLDDLNFNRFLQQSMQINERSAHKNLVAKKYHIEKEPEQQNPYLFGERLPVAAKKGTNVGY